ncbi:MAG: DUF2945 domain-containing protein [Candidatus Cyclobacteriaceae bacterium M2_1C_046]
MSISKGDNVKWKWGQGYGEGEVEKTYNESVTRKIKGAEITRHGSDDDKALYIKQDNGDRVLKLEREVQKA